MPLDVRREPEAENRLEQRVSRPGDALLYGSGMMGGAVLIVSGVCFLTQPYLIRGWQQYLAGAALTAYGAGFAYVAHWMHKERQR
ncbi:hypothetical protein HY642_04525 [Candidatus Woesearchaeota archaeon]|nr:hypothetical protein [Candidatus Woesearchaeota archaeon]